MGIIFVEMTTQKIFGLLVNEQKTPIIEKPDNKMQCYLCGFSFQDADECLIIFIDEDLSDKRVVHAKCIQNHLRLLSDDASIALVSDKTNEVLSYTKVSEKV